MRADHSGQAHAHRRRAGEVCIPKRLSELDVSQNGGLVELYINDNRLMAIDLSGCPKLKYFYATTTASRSWIRGQIRCFDT